MESASESTGSRGARAILRSPTVIFSLILVAVYITIGAIVGNFFGPLLSANIILDFLVQCDAPTPIFPWTVLTAVFLHANILHIASNVFFLLFFVLGLDIFAGGGGPAHLGGLVAGLILRRYWSLGGGTFRGI